ncbi:MAG TPA: hypothetical protein VGU61_08595 [Noviherbaspirillum sp.]|jgi:hypothetical protein|uniref:hypothetical protein n=1 Tax=Noviherbaspirillum sp. TaxID=1926288 RepID=UPI002DDCAA46|nr:hypothetical protein [Noviherbaspirillum sp.]HEV2610311.1 hypothetical protein [Noviherbaspirillum sp.]
MQTPSGDTRLAQPATEEMKLHGDQLGNEVEAAAGIKKQENQNQRTTNSEGDGSAKQDNP